MILQHLQFVLKALVIFAVMAFSVSASSQDEPALPATPEAGNASTTDEKAEVPLFVVPQDADADALFQFINKVKTTPPQERTQEAQVAHLKLQVAAVIQACDLIMATKPDEESEVRTIMERFAGYEILTQVDEDAVQSFQDLVEKYSKDKRESVAMLVGGYQLKQRAQGLFTLSDENQAKLVDDLFAHIRKFGLDQRTVGVAQGLGQALENSDNPGLGGVVYHNLATELKKLNNPAIAPQIAHMEAVARRLNLPGKFMEISGTTADGEEFDWASYRGKVVLVDFWASWCGPCRAEIPNMKAQLEKYGDKGFAIVGVNLDSTKAEYQAIVEQEELQWVNLMSQDENERGWDHPLARHYGISGIPTAILVDKDGKVISMTARGGELNRLLDAHLNQPDAAAPDSATPTASEDE